MKRGTPFHPKTLDLAGRLGVERWGAVGVLESLWHFAGQYARRGDVGRHSDQSIAAGIGWTGDATQLVEALIGAGWLDRCECHRLRVHDWEQHADQAVHKTKEIENQGFIECYSSGGPPSLRTPVSAQGIRQTAQGTGQTAQGLDPVRAVFDHWRKVMGHEDAKLTPDRRTKVEARLREKYTQQQLCEAIDGCAASAFHMGANEHHTRHDDLTLILRNGSNVERFRRMRPKPRERKPAKCIRCEAAPPGTDGLCDPCRKATADFIAKLPPRPEAGA